MKLYLIHDSDYTFNLSVKANNRYEAVEKIHIWFDAMRYNTKNWNSRNVEWFAILCDNDNIIE